MLKTKDLSLIQQELAKKYSGRAKTRIIIGMGTCGIAAGAEEILSTAKNEIKKQNLSNIELDQTGCIGLCAEEPLMEIRMDEKRYIYGNVDQEKAAEIIKQHIVNGNVINRWLVDQESDFFRKQQRIVLKNCGNINPENIEEAIANHGYQGLARAVNELTPEEVIEIVKDAKLRGRGGAGFSTGMKWGFAATKNGRDKYLICNADEGDPGAFMDRSILEGDPHRLIEGMTIAGYAIGANKGYIYCRAEYPLAIKRLKKAIKDAKEMGVLGENILDSGFDFEIDIRLGAGAFVCGEETSLIASIEGKRGEPRPKPPYPTDSGLYGKATVINNVETFANVPEIIRNGSSWFKNYGTADSPGTKVFALAGKIKNNGLVEVPMGTSLGEIVFDIGGGLENDADFKAAQTGGPSGGCIPIEHLNVPVDYDSLSELGTIMGSGGLIIMDDQTCMVDLAKYFVDFCVDESCGQCTPCRIGTTRMLEILEKISLGEANRKDFELLMDMGEKIKDSSFCGLGQTAPNPVLSTIRYFEDEYFNHIDNKHCDSSVCAALFTSPCQNACPANVDVPMYINYIREGNYREAYKVIQEENPLAVVCGRVCYNLCEDSCNRGAMDEALAIRELKRFAGDYLLKEEDGFPVPEIEAEKDKRVAIVGSGPSGLTAAFYLRKKGYQVTIFEAETEVGGMLALGIPEYRLPKDILNEEIGVLTAMGVDIIVDTKVGKDITLEELKEEGFWAVYLAVGAEEDRSLYLEGQDVDGIYSALEILHDINKGKKLKVKGKKVAVVGGGNAAIDVARNMVRLGAEEINIVYRRTKNDMPAHKEEIDEAEYEQINIYPQINPVKIHEKDGKIDKLECVKIEGGKFDTSGRRRPKEVEGSNFLLDTDIVISAIGQQVDQTFKKGKFDIEMAGSTIKTNSNYSTNIDWIFAGGDCVSGPSTVIESIQQGKEAAAEIDKYLGGDGKVVKSEERERKINLPIIEEEKRRVKMPTILLAERKKGFKEVEKGYSLEQAREEASRCLRCDVKDKAEEVI